MDQQMKAKWVAALRSGEYKQTTRKLREVYEDGSVGFCCLGVLCDLSGMGRWEGSLYHDEGDHVLAGGNRLWELGTRYGLKRGEAVDLAYHNDIDKWSFDQIADYIEKNL